jgi:hypothetical protein
MSDERLAAVFADSAAPARDARYVMAVMERAEEARWRGDMRLKALRAAGVAAAAAGALALMGDWAWRNPDASLSALVIVTGLLTALGAARLIRSGLAAG